MKKVGLALEGGGLKGSYQIGAYYAFLKCHIKISGIVGTSIGSFNACLIAAHQEKELLNLWRTLEPEKLLDINHDYSDYINGTSSMLKGLKGLNITLLNALYHRGLSTKKLRNLAEELINKDKLYKSKIDFGLITVRLKTMKPLCVFKEAILPEKLVDYLIASCSLPIFKLEPLIDDHIYIDGGFYDNCPVNMLIEKNYDKIYAIRINGIGRNRKLKNTSAEVITIHPSRNICSIMEMNHEKIQENILLGYYDTLRVLKHYDGYKYTFKKCPEFIIKLLVRGVKPKELNRIKLFFKTTTTNETIIKAVEYCLEKEKMSYYKVYNIISVINYLKKYSQSQNHVVKFIKKLRIF